MPKLVHSVQKKQHRERSQPQNRKRFGLLEKKKDYKLRAENYHQKQAQLKLLRQKAAAHNEDEYYHAMTRRKTDKDGILLADRGNAVLSVEEALLLKSQDSNYINTLRTNELNKIKKQSDNLVLESTGKHTVFVDSHEEKDNFDPVAHFQTDERLLYRRENRLKLSQLAGEDELHNIVSDKGLIEEFQDSNGFQKAKRDLKRLKEAQLLQRRMEREKQLRNIQSKMDLQKNLMKKGEKKKVVTKEGKTVFKWKNQRKR